MQVRSAVCRASQSCHRLDSLAPRRHAPQIDARRVFGAQVGAPARDQGPCPCGAATWVRAPHAAACCTPCNGALLDDLLTFPAAPPSRRMSYMLNRASEDECPAFYDSNGNVIQPMCADYGFRSGSGRLYSEHYGETPGSVLDLVGAGTGRCWMHTGCACYYFFLLVPHCARFDGIAAL